jgi:hypothetical protein
MGAWGVKAFENDEAGDWALSLREVPNLSFIEVALVQVLESEDYLDAHSATEGIAACETLARLLGRPGYHDPHTQVVDEWVKRHPLKPSDELVAQGLAAIDRVLGENSELPELWRESESVYDEWLEGIEDLRSRLRGLQVRMN